MELDLKDYITVIKKRMWLILSIVIVTGAATAAWSYYFITPVYEASTKLIVTSSNDQYGSAVNAQLNLNDINFHIRLIETYKEIIRTEAIMEKVAMEYESLNLSAEQLVKMVRVSAANNTMVMTLSVQDASYTRAMHVVNAVSEVFQREIPHIMSVDNVSLLDRAKPVNNPTPVKPNPELNIAISIVIALMIGVGLAFLLEYLDDTIKSEEDVRSYLELPTLGAIVKLNGDDMQVGQVATKKRKGGGKTYASIDT